MGSSSGASTTVRRAPDEAVFPNSGGSPCGRMDGVPKGSRHGWFPNAVEGAGLKGKVTFHSERHMFAVRLLTRGIRSPS